MKSHDHQLIQQGPDIVTVLWNEVPVLGSYKNEYACSLATNFLRCGCPGVQILLGARLIDETISWSWEEEVRELKRYFKALRLKGEQFEFSCSEAPPFVLFVTRRSKNKAASG